MVSWNDNKATKENKYNASALKMGAGDYL